MSHTLVTLISAQKEAANTAIAQSQEDPGCQPFSLGLVEQAGGVLGKVRPETAVLLVVALGVILALMLSVGNLRARVAMLERLMAMR